TRRRARPVRRLLRPVGCRAQRRGSEAGDPDLRHAAGDHVVAERSLHRGDGGASAADCGRKLRRALVDPAAARQRPAELGVGSLIERLRARARGLKRDTYALYLACRDPRTPWYAKALAGAVVAYALSPIDLIPDFVPVFGYLDDLIIVPAGLVLARKLIPESVIAECQARVAVCNDGPVSRV